MRSIRAKIFLVVISFLLIMSFAFSFYAVNTTTNYRKLRINELAATVQYKSERINTYITEMEQDALSLANAASVFYLYTDRRENIGNTIVLNNIHTFPTAAGGGIWFEPFRLDPARRFACFYACYNHQQKLALRHIGKIDPEKLNAISYDPANHTYLRVGGKAGTAFSDGNQLK